MGLVLVFSNINDLTHYLVGRVDEARKNGNNCIFVDSVQFKNYNRYRDAVNLLFANRGEKVEARPCPLGYYDFIITWQKEEIAS